jgi:DNA-binding XRE family transcriptional regulator
MIVGNWPLVYDRQPSTMFDKMAKRWRIQIQPRSGVEKAFGQIVRTIREELNISQAELEKRTGLNRTFISDLERGIQGPGIRTIFRIARGLETSPCSLLNRTAHSKYFEFPVGKESD